MRLTRRRTRPFPSAEETIRHPAYPATIWALEPHRHGKLAAAKHRGGPVHIAWEIHGTGPIKLVVCNNPLSIAAHGEQPKCSMIPSVRRKVLMAAPDALLRPRPRRPVLSAAARQPRHGRQRQAPGTVLNKRDGPRCTRGARPRRVDGAARGQTSWASPSAA
ncbi:hypothetical protein G7046_g6908 [Stylonectria norvegica]|nr:hypothetical protein G7046_g6908 [Stylonectria norvegica]